MKPIKVNSKLIAEINTFRDMIMAVEYRKTVLVVFHNESYFIEGYEGVMKKIHLN